LLFNQNILFGFELQKVPIRLIHEVIGGKPYFNETLFRLPKTWDNSVLVQDSEGNLDVLVVNVGPLASI
jgi:hypothetical protein